MLRLRERSAGNIHTVFILGLFTMFVATSFLLVLIGIKQYSHTTRMMNENYENRTASAYLTEKVRQHNNAGNISVTKLDGSPALVLSSTEDGYYFITFIYYYDGAIRELVVTQNSVYSLSSGQKIIAAQDFNVEYVSGSLIRAKITDSNGELQTLFFDLCANTQTEVD